MNIIDEMAKDAVVDKYFLRLFQTLEKMYWDKILSDEQMSVNRLSSSEYVDILTFADILSLSSNAQHKNYALKIISCLKCFYEHDSRYIYYSLVRVIDIIISIANGDSIKTSDYLNFFAQVFAILGTLIYTELIELNFCNLNYNLKKNIISRSLEDASNASKNNINEDSIFNLDNDSSIDVGSIVDNF